MHVGPIIAPARETSTALTQACITQFHLQTPGLPLSRKRSPDGAKTDCVANI